MGRPVFDLTANPFHVLGVAAASDRPEATEAYKRALAEKRHGEGKLGRAFEALMAPKARLEAELSWFLFTPPPVVAQVMQKIAEHDYEGCVALLDKVVAFDLANVGAHLCAVGVAAPECAQCVVDAYLFYDENGAARIVAQNRALADIPRPSAAMVREALQDLRHRHARAVLAWALATPEPGRSMIEAIATLLELEEEEEEPLWEGVDVDTDPPSILPVLASFYEEETAPTLERLEKEIAAGMARRRTEPNAAGTVEAIVAALAKWASHHAPTQVMARLNGEDDLRSTALYKKLRAFYLWLANERSAYDEALSVAAAVRGAVVELPSPRLQLENDLCVLRGLAAEQAPKRPASPPAPAPTWPATKWPGATSRAPAPPAPVRSAKPASHRKYHVVMLASVLAGLGAVAYLATNPLHVHPAGWPVATASVGSGDLPNEADMAETPPVAGSNAVLTLPELRYCEFERERIDHLTPMITVDVRAQFNAAVDAFKAVCVGRVYRDSDMARVTTERLGHWVAIDVDAEHMLASWVMAAGLAQAQGAISSMNGSASPSLPVSTAPPPPSAPAESRPAAASGLRYDISTTFGAIEVQAELQSRGFYQGKVDGVWGPQSAAALRAWKIRVGLAPDAAWDAATEQALMGE